MRGIDVAIVVSKPRFPKLLPTEKAFATERTARVANRIDAGEANGKFRRSPSMASTMTCRAPLYKLYSSE